jgi:hypothetical protein
MQNPYPSTAHLHRDQDELSVFCPWRMYLIVLNCLHPCDLIMFIGACRCVTLPGKSSSSARGSVQWARCSEPAAFPSPSQVGTRDIRVTREAPAGALWSHEASGVSRAVVHCVDSKSDRFVRSWHDGRYRGRRTRLPPQCAGRARAMVPQPRRYHGSVKLGRRLLTAAKP